MAEEKAEWFIPGRDRKPVGPYTVDQVIRALRIGRIKPQTVCWREGMAEWLPIEQIPAFAHLLQPAQMQRGLTRFQCSCGNEIVMSAKFAGKQAKCSSCGAVVTVPAYFKGPQTFLQGLFEGSPDGHSFSHRFHGNS